VNVDRAEVERVLKASLSSPIGAEELEELMEWLRFRAEQARQLRSLALGEEEPSLPPSLEERP
jgi:hypothetical protein